ncbi:MAG: ATP phosphoribosyltransferase [SAR202 cluster bacterium]|nr:ATP phosphoribosyltransferase [SAR202 cluster bacterium]
MSYNGSNGLRLILPSDGALDEPSRDFMKACSLSVKRPSSRRYTGFIPTIKGATVLFQRAADVTSKIEEASADLGITGLDRYLEYHREGGDAILIMEDLGFGQCDLVLAVPNAWLDVTSMSDLADVALEFRQQGRPLRIATKFHRLVRRFLLEHGINHFNLIMTSGAIEAAPAAGFADLIADLTASGETLRENRLRPLEDGTVLSAQACLVGNRATLRKNSQALRQTRAILEMMEGYLQSRGYYRLSANLRAKSAEDVASKILTKRELAGFRGPTVSRVYNVDGEGWHTVNLVISRERMLEVTDHLRSVGATDISVSPLGYMFKEQCAAYEALLRKLGV